jgi:hypothetical protein
MATYATADDYNDIFDPSAGIDEEVLEPFLLKAERDIDSACGRRGSYITDRRFDPTVFTEQRAEILAMATCAQAQYRMMRGDEFFASTRPVRQSSREGSQDGQEAYIGPTCSQFLAQGGFYSLVRGSGRNPNLYDLPNQNTGI